MSYAAPGFAGIGWIDNEDRGRRSRFAIGVAVSIALHALLLSAYRGHPLPSEQHPEPRRSIAVWLRPPPPPAVPNAAEPAPPVQVHAQHRPPARPQRRRHRVITVPPTAPAQRDQPFTVQQPPGSPSEPNQPHFDRDAALKMARKLANAPDPARAATAVGQFPEKALATETRAARAIGAAKRGDCKDGLPGGLLGPLIILLDKKDSGCKW